MADKRKPTPGMLGTGSASQAAEKLAGRKKQLEAQECRAYGGMYDFASGKCKQDK